jgi:protein-disulfide isomerase
MRTNFLLLATTVLSLFLFGCSSSVAKPIVRGDASAPVSIEEFSDFQCPACGQTSPQIDAFAKANPSLVRLSFYHFPLPQHEFAFRAAEAAECANLQGKFWEYSETLFQNQNNLTDSEFKQYADTLKLDTASFNQCLDSNQTSDAVKADQTEGANRGVSYTPSLYVNGKLLQFSTMDAFEGYVKSLK